MPAQPPPIGGQRGGECCVRGIGLLEEAMHTDVCKHACGLACVCTARRYSLVGSAVVRAARMLVVLLAPVVTKVPAGGPPASRANSDSAAARPAAAAAQPREKGVTMRRDTSAELLLTWGHMWVSGCVRRQASG